MDKKKKTVGRQRNIGGDTAESLVEHVKLVKKAKADFNNARDNEDYLKIIKNLNEATKSEMPDISALIGHCYIKVGKYETAVHCFAEAADKAEKDPEHHNWCGYCYQNLKQYDQALFHFTKAIELKTSKNGEYYFNRASVKKEINNFEDAIKDFEMAINSWEHNISSDPKTQNFAYQAYYSKGICLRQLERFNESIQDLKKAVELKPEEPSAHNNLGMSFFKKGDFDDATNEYTKAIQNIKSENKGNEFDFELKDAIASYCNNRGLAFYHQRKYEEAKQDFDEAIDLNPQDATYYFNRGNNTYDLSLLMREDHEKEEQAENYYDEAHKDYDRSIDLQPQDPRFYHSKGLAFEGTNNDKDFESAIQNFKMALSIDENFFGSRVHLGNMYHKNNDFHNALKCYSTFLNNYLTHEDVYVSRGMVCQDMGNHQFAIKDFDTAIKLNDVYSDAYYHRGVSKLKTKYYEDAINDLNKALETKTKDNYGIYDALGCCFQALKNYDEAFKYMDEAISNDPENVHFLMNRAQCHFELRQYTESIQDLERALEIDEHDSKTLYKLGLSYYAFGKYKRCIKTLKRSLKSINEQFTSGTHFVTYESDIYYHIGIAYSNLERFEEAIYPLTKAIELIPSDIKYIHERAKAYQMIEEHTTAIEDFTTVINKNPNNAHAFFRRAFSQKALKFYREAADDFETAKEKDPLNQKLVVNYKKLSGITCIVL